MASSAVRPSNSTFAAARPLHVRAEIGFAVDGVAMVHLALWARRGRRRPGTPFWDEVVRLHRQIVTVASYVMPPPPPDVVVDVSPPEPALFERVPGEDEVRLRVRAIGKCPVELDTWAQALSTNLRAIDAKVESSRSPRPATRAGGPA